MDPTLALPAGDSIAVEPDAGLTSPRQITREIERFLSGESDGGDLMGALYDDVLDEPIPHRLLAVLRGCC